MTGGEVKSLQPHNRATAWATVCKNAKVSGGIAQSTNFNEMEVECIWENEVPSPAREDVQKNP